MRTFLVALMIAVLALPAYAEAAGRRHRGASQTTERGKPKVDDKAYGAALSTLPDKTYDPWQSVR